MNSDFEIRFSYGEREKIIFTDNLNSAERMYEKIIRFADNHSLSGTVALWDNKWCIKYTNF